MPQIRAAAENAHTFVWGGDIFDFQWSTIGDLEATADAAHDWLTEFIQTYDDCQFHYVLGNHDCHPTFVRRLAALADRSANLTWHPYIADFGDTICLHGDVADHLTTQAQLESKRSRWGHKAPRNQVRNAVYDVTVAARLHRIAPVIAHRKRSVTRRLLHYLDEHGYGADSGLQHVYFGHTHSCLDFVYQGIHFHNGGAPLKHLPFRILQLEIPA